jgi:hypothetical protein
VRFQYNDGGRKKAGYKGTAGDCGIRAISIVTEKPYQEVYDTINILAKSERTRRGGNSNSRTGVWPSLINKYLVSLEYKWTPTMFIGSGCRVHLKEEELPKGRLLIRLSKHYTTVIDGVINDTYDCSRNETRCVYGYWSKK